MKKETIVIAEKILADLTFSAFDSDQIVIFCHGYKGYKDWGAWNLVAKEFSRNGLDFLKFNFSLNGGTLENPIDFPDLDAFGRNTYSQEVKDLNVVIDYVSNRFPNKEICLIGHSRGGGIVNLVAAQNQKVKKLISWAGVSDFKSRFPVGVELEKWKKEGVRYVLNGRTKQEMPHYFSFYEDFIKKESELDILAWVAQINIPHLIVHGTSDFSVKVSEADALKGANPRAEMFLLDADHTFGSVHPWEGKELPSVLKIVVSQTIKFVK